MLKFFETNSEVLFRRDFILEEDGRVIGGGALVWRDRVVYVEDFRLEDYRADYADLLAGALLNAACNTQADAVRVPEGAHWARFGLNHRGEYLEAKLEHIVFDSECKSRESSACGGDCAHCGDRKGGSGL